VKLHFSSHHFPLRVVVADFRKVMSFFEQALIAPKEEEDEEDGSERACCLIKFNDDKKN
jgi:hypothetical protein